MFSRKMIASVVGALLMAGFIGASRDVTSADACGAGRERRQERRANRQARRSGDCASCESCASCEAGVVGSSAQVSCVTYANAAYGYGSGSAGSMAQSQPMYAAAGSAGSMATAPTTCNCNCGCPNCTCNKTQQAPATSQPSSPVALPGANTPADRQSTPSQGVSAMLEELKPTPNEVLLDPGCGDANVLIQACQKYGTVKAVGIEIDPEIAESARRNVRAAGLSDHIQIITGDSTKLNIKADIGVAYMWPEFLQTFRPQIEHLNRFVSYSFPVPGLQPMTKKSVAGGGTIYSWTQFQSNSNQQSPQLQPTQVQVARVPVTRSVRKTVSLPRGSYCEVCGGRCSNPMAHVQYQQIVGYRDVAVAPSQQLASTASAVPSAAVAPIPQQQVYIQQPQAYRTVTRRVCDGHGHCHMEAVRIPVML